MSNIYKPKGLFITATGTDVGKTFVTGLLLKKLREQGINAGYYKAALSGAERVNDQLIPGDAEYVCSASGITEEPSSLVSYIYETAVSPHFAATLEKNPIEFNVIHKDFKSATQRYEYLCVEGSGGIVCPLRIDEEQTIMLTDIIIKLNLSIIIVATALLGTINSTVLTVEYARTRGINIKGIILNYYDNSNIMHKDNKKQIEFLTGVPVIACVKIDANKIEIETKQLCRLFEEV